MQPQSKWTIKDVLQWTADYFKTKGIRSSRLDAEVLLAHCLGTDRLHLYLNLDRPLSASERLKFRELVRRRAIREPVSLIIGRKEFWSLTLSTSPGVLIPRPDTEVLVQSVLDWLKDHQSPIVLDIGTGSGAISVALAKERPDIIIYASDISCKALTLARENTNGLGFSNVIHLFASDLFNCLRPLKMFDVIVSNPPYIPDKVIDTLEPEIHFEPLSALSAGPLGLAIIEKLIPSSKEFLKQGGFLAIEIGGADQALAVTSCFENSGFTSITVHKDLSGNSRVVTGRLEI